MRDVPKCLALIWAAILVVLPLGCSKDKAKPLVPLPLESGVKTQAVTLNEQGTQAYRGRQYEEAKAFFSQAVAAAPESGPAHYNFALALNALGDSEQARRHFIEAANLAPGDKVIWDSPPLSPYNNPEPENKPKVAPPQNPNRRGIGGRTP